MKPGEFVVVGSSIYTDMYLKNVDLYAFPGSVLQPDLALQMKNHNDFMAANCADDGSSMDRQALRSLVGLSGAISHPM